MTMETTIKLKISMVSVMLKIRLWVKDKFS